MLPEDKSHGKNPVAVALGRLGGLKGGEARAKNSLKSNVRQLRRKLPKNVGQNKRDFT
jgi:hypothetical protein